ncbi:MAG: autorepressor SdpR family transcription factor [Oscillospiraceae bacterium]
MGLADTFKALSDPMRREILTLLRAGRLSAGEIARHFGATPAAMSYHLALLKRSGLVMEYKQKNYIYYELNTSVFDDLVLWLRQFGGENDEE